MDKGSELNGLDASKNYLSEVPTTTFATESTRVKIGNRNTLFL